MKWLILIVVPLLLCAVFVPRRTPQADRPEVGKPAPVIRLNDQTGRGITVGKKNKSGAWSAVAFYPKAMTPG